MKLYSRKALKRYFGGHDLMLLLIVSISLICLIFPPTFLVARTNLHQRERPAHMLPILFLVVFALLIPIAVYQLRVMRELKSNDVCERTIILDHVGKGHFFQLPASRLFAHYPKLLVLFDTEGNQYRFAGNDVFSYDLAGARLNLTYLPKTGFLLCAELLNEDSNSPATQAFDACLHDYAVSKELRKMME